MRGSDSSRVSPSNPFLRELPTDCDIEFPIAHAEGRLVAPPGEAARYAREGLAALTYAGSNPNGSEEAIAGLQDASGRVFGLMPHPERFLFATQHPQWTRLGLRGEGQGIQIFRNAVTWFE